MLRKVTPLLIYILLISDISVAFTQQEGNQIEIDGKSDDWFGIEPIFIDPEGDTTFAHDPGSDIKAIYSKKDNNSLYFMIEFSGPANQGNLLDFYFNEITEGPADHFMFGASGFVSWSESWKEKDVKVAYRDVAEMSFPTSLFENLAILYVNPGVYIPSLQKWDDGAGRWVEIWIDKSKGVKIVYNIIIHEHNRVIEVLANIANLQYFKKSENNFRFYLGWWHHPIIFNISFSSNDILLNYEFLDMMIWKVKLPEIFDSITAHYFLNLTYVPANSCYFGEDYIVAHTSNMFIYPESCQIDEIRFYFVLPKNWVVVAHCNQEDDYYYSNDIKYIQRGFLAAGIYNVEECLINNINLIIAVHNRTRISILEIFKSTKACFNYLLNFLRFPFTDVNKFLVIFAPPPSICGTADYGGPSCTIDSMNDAIGMVNIAHEIFHILDGFSGGILEEGLTQYYSYKASFAIGLWDIDSFYNYLTVFGNEGIEYYYTDIWNTVYNLPLINKELWEMSDPPLFWIKSRKPAIIAYMLDKEIEHVTNGRKNLNDVIVYLNSKYLDPHHDVSTEEFLDTVNKISDSNFTEFFIKYIFGNDWLPPTPVENWLNYYINKAEEMASSLKSPFKEQMKSGIYLLKNNRDRIINLIYDEKYTQAFQDLENAINSSKELIRILFDEEPPTIENIAYAPLNPKFSDKVSIDALCSDKISGIHSTTLLYSVNHGPWINQSMKYEEGVYTSTIDEQGEGALVEFYIIAIDKLGNRIKSEPRLYGLPSKPPTISDLTTQPSIPTPDDDIIVSATVIDEESGVDWVKLRYSPDGTEWKSLPMNPSGKTYTATIPRQNEGTKITYQIEASDKASNITNSTTGSYVVKNKLVVLLLDPILIISAIMMLGIAIVILMMKKMA